jgi:hypothetical protein
MDTTMSKARKYSLKPEDVKHYLVQDRLPNSYLMASRPDDEARIVADVKRRMMWQAFNELAETLMQGKELYVNFRTITREQDSDNPYLGDLMTLDVYIGPLERIQDEPTTVVAGVNMVMGQAVRTARTDLGTMVAWPWYPEAGIEKIAGILLHDVEAGKEVTITEVRRDRFTRNKT